MRKMVLQGGCVVRASCSDIDGRASFDKCDELAFPDVKEDEYEEHDTYELPVVPTAIAIENPEATPLYSGWVFRSSIQHCGQCEMVLVPK